MVAGPIPEKHIQQAVELLTQNGFGDKIKIAFDEWNLRGWHHPGFPGGGGNQLGMIQERDENDLHETYTMADAIFTASFLNGCLRQAKYVHMACMAPVVNARGPLFVHPKGVVKRTTFHVMKMYSDLLLPNVVNSQVTSDVLNIEKDSVPALDAVVTQSEDGKRLAVALINRHPDMPARLKLSLGSAVNPVGARLTILSGDAPDAFNGLERPNRVVPETRALTISEGQIELPPHSVAIAQFG
jgi:alpha-L-arabinofuranosidase